LLQNFHLFVVILVHKGSLKSKDSSQNSLGILLLALKRKRKLFDKSNKISRWGGEWERRIRE